MTDLIFDGNVHHIDDDYSYCLFKISSEELLDNKNVKKYLDKLLINIFLHIKSKGEILFKECIHKFNSDNCLIKPMIICKPPSEWDPLNSYGTIAIKFKRVDKDFYIV